MSRGTGAISVWSCLVAGVLLFQVGCGAGLRAGSEDSLTGGVAIDMLVTDQESSHGFYRLTPDGTISFGGGWDALREDTTWSGSISADEAAELDELLRANGWYRGRPVPAALATDLTGDDTRIHRIHFAWPGGAWKVEVDHGGGQIAPVREFLKAASFKRHQDVIDQLPQAGLQDQ